MKIINLLLIALLAISQCQAAATAACDTAGAALEIQTSVTKLTTAGGAAIASWDDLVTCLKDNLDSTDDKTTIDVIIDSNISGTKTSALDLTNAKIVTASTTMSFTIKADSQFASGDLKTIFYDVLDTMYGDASAKQVAITIHSDIAPTPAELDIIKTHTDDAKIPNTSTFEVGQTDKCASSAFATCLVSQTANEAAVKTCAPSLQLYGELSLASTKPAEMKTCLASLNTGSAKVTKLTVDLSDATTAPVADDIDFDTILTGIKGDFTDLTINLSNSGTKAAAVVFAVDNLSIDYSNITLTNDESEAIITGLKNAATAGAGNFEFTFSKKDDTNVKSLESAVKLLEIGTLSATKFVNVYDGTADCVINGTEVNGNTCNFVVVQPTVNDSVLEQCDNVTVSFDSDLAEGLDGSKLDWAVTTGTISTWTSQQLTDKAVLTDLPIADITKQTYVMSVSGAVSKDSKVIPVVYKTVEFTVNECKPSTTFLVGSEAIAATYPICANAIADFTFGVVQDLTNKQNDEKLVDGTTTYTWNLQNKPATGANTDVTVAGKKNEATFTVLGSELAQGKTYVLSLTIGAPEVIVDDYEFTIAACDQTPVIHVNGAAVTTDKVSACQDLVITIADNDKVTLDATTTYAWSLMKDTTDVLADGSIKKDTASITVPKASLADGSYTATVDITKPTLAQATASVEIDTSITCDNGGDDDKKDDDDDDSSSLLSVTLALVLALALLF